MSVVKNRSIPPITQTHPDYIAVLTNHLQLVISAHHMVYAAAAILIVWALIAFRWEIVSSFMQGICKEHYQPFD